MRAKNLYIFNFLRHFKVLPLLVLQLSFPLSASISLKGYLTDEINKPVSGAIVSLVNNPLIDTTDTSGFFHLQSLPNPVLSEFTRFIRNRILIGNNVINFYPSNRELFFLELYTLSGKRIASIRQNSKHAAPLAISTLAIANGAYLLRIGSDQNTMTIKILLTSANTTSAFEFGAQLQSSINGEKIQATVTSTDTLVIVQGTSRSTIPLKSLNDTTISIRITSKGPVRCIESVSAGGMWFDTKTWKGGIIPDKSNDVIINGAIYACVSGTDTSACHSLTINRGAVLRAEPYSARTITIFGNLTNYGDVRNGPDYASYDNASLTVRIHGNFTQDSLYRPGITLFSGDYTQNLAIGAADYLSGTFVDKTPGSPLVATTALKFNSFSLRFDSTATSGTLSMGNNEFHLAGGSFTLLNGTLATNILRCDSLTEFTCNHITSVSGPTVIRGSLRTDTITFDSTVIVDSGSVVYNLSYKDVVMTVKGDLINNGLIRRGPGYAAYGEGNLALSLHKNFFQNGLYTVQHTTFTGAANHTLTVNPSSLLQGTYYSNTAATSLIAASSIRFKDFSLDFGTSGGGLIMGQYEPVITSGSFTLKGGTLETAVIKGDSLTTFTCKNVKASSGNVTLKGYICSDTLTIDGDCIVDKNSIFYNKSNTDAVITVKGSFINNGLTRRGPGYAAYGEGNLAILIEKDFRQNGIYTVQLTRFTGSNEQKIGTDSGKILQGIYYDDTPNSGLKATTPLIITEAKFVLSPDTINHGLFSMDTFRLTHSSGLFQIDSGTLQVDSVTGGDDGGSPFTVRKIITKNGSVSINKHYRTSSCIITGTLIVEENGRFYNQANLEAYVTTTATTIRGKIGSGPGYAAYGEGLLYLNGVKLDVWR